MQVTVQQMASARIPTDVGEFQLHLYHNNHDSKEHLALVMGNIQGQLASGQPHPLVRIHSECFTGDALGSLRCDCGPQLQMAMEHIAREGAGLIIYLRQEGRGIGLLDKLRAYNLQDEGYDTVEANLMLGHEADARDYTIASLILRDLGIRSLRLMTNNPHKLDSLAQQGFVITERVPLQTAVHPHNHTYLTTKVQRMRHLLDLPPIPDDNGTTYPPAARLLPGPRHLNRPFITLSYAQSLDGSITKQRGQPLAISSPQAMRLTHQIRASHQAILVGIGTILADNPSLTVRLIDGRSPQPIVLDSHLRFPLPTRLQNPWVITTPQASQARQQQLEQQGVQVMRVNGDENGRIHLPTLLSELCQRGIHSLMVEGGAEIITAFLTQKLVDRLIVTIAPILVGGLHAIQPLPHIPRLQNSTTHQIGQDTVVIGDFV
ncbi:MAG: GTP cyclohydrolase II [Ardenticatenaceae bacterium]|nr:GTP cyclohydrolase II [Ardenticatenaceae bacterium]